MISMVIGFHGLEGSILANENVAGPKGVYLIFINRKEKYVTNTTQYKKCTDLRSRGIHVAYINKIKINK